MRSTVPPGLYALGEPGRDSDVLVTANYKLSFDMLRRALHGLDAVAAHGLSGPVEERQSDVPLADAGRGVPAGP